jgi:hypothetical protein
VLYGTFLVLAAGVYELACGNDITDKCEAYISRTIEQLGLFLTQSEVFKQCKQEEILRSLFNLRKM